MIECEPGKAGEKIKKGETEQHRDKDKKKVEEGPEEDSVSIMLRSMLLASFRAWIIISQMKTESGAP